MSRRSAFGGMLAFCIIVGDTIPHVITALMPSMAEMPVFWLFTDRRAVIIIFVLGVSYPLSLYRDIAKVRPSVHTPWELQLQANQVTAGKSIHLGAHQHAHYPRHHHHARRPGSSGFTRAL